MIRVGGENYLSVQANVLIFPMIYFDESGEVPSNSHR